METHATVFWLKVASVIVIGSGIIIAMAAFPATAEPTRLFIDLIFWPIDGVESLNAHESRILCAVGGGIITGLGVMFWLVSTRLYPKDPELARTLVLASSVSWFLVDSTASVAAGAPLNAILNIPFLLLLVAPIWKASRPAASRRA